MRSAESSAEPRAEGHGSSGETGRTECGMMNAECEITERENRRNGESEKRRQGANQMRSVDWRMRNERQNRETSEAGPGLRNCVTSGGEPRDESREPRGERAGALRCRRSTCCGSR